MAKATNPNLVQQPGVTAPGPMPITPATRGSTTGATTGATTSTTTGGAPDVMQTSANLFNAAAAGPNINQFMNPYTSSVADQAMQNLNRQQQMSINDIGAAASRAGAFGGSRHGVAEALTNTGYAQQGANMYANLQNQGFTTALQAAQNQQGIQSGLAGQGFGFGRDLANQQWQYGDAAQRLNQSLIDAARGQYSGFTGAPNNALQQLMASIGAANMGQSTTTQTSNPGFWGVLGGLMSIL